MVVISLKFHLLSLFSLATSNAPIGSTVSFSRHVLGINEQANVFARFPGSLYFAWAMAMAVAKAANDAHPSNRVMRSTGTFNSLRHAISVLTLLPRKRDQSSLKWVFRFILKISWRTHRALKRLTALGSRPRRAALLQPSQGQFRRSEE